MPFQRAKIPASEFFKWRADLRLSAGRLRFKPECFRIVRSGNSYRVREQSLELLPLFWSPEVVPALRSPTQRSLRFHLLGPENLATEGEVSERVEQNDIRLAKELLADLVALGLERLEQVTDPLTILKKSMEVKVSTINQNEG